MEDQEIEDIAGRIQLHLVLPYKHQVKDHPRVRGYLERGWRIRQLQRLSDREVVVTLAALPPTPSPPG